MSLQEIYYVAEMVVGLAVIISIIFVAIELRQNTYAAKKSNAEQRETRLEWLYQNLIFDEEFRGFQQKTANNWEELTDDEKVRATTLGVQILTPLLNELVAHFDNQLSKNEFRILDQGLKLISQRPHAQRAFQFLKDRYSSEVQDYWLKTVQAAEPVPTMAEVALS